MDSTTIQNDATVPKIFLILPEQIEWLKRQKSEGGTRKAASATVRELINRAMQEENEQPPTGN